MYTGPGTRWGQFRLEGTMAKLDFVPKVGPFRFTAGVGPGCWSVLGLLFVLFVVCCCCGTAFFQIAGN